MVIQNPWIKLYCFDKISATIKARLNVSSKETMFDLFITGQKMVLWLYFLSKINLKRYD